MRKFFEVVAKCGHVGRGYYYEGVFYEIASDASYAAKIVRGRGRVKHDHKDAILSVREISQEEFELGLKAKENNPYYSCSNKREQDAVWEQVCFGVRREKFYDEIDEDYIEKRRNKVQYKLRKQRQNIRSFDRYYDEVLAI